MTDNQHLSDKAREIKDTLASISPRHGDTNAERRETVLTKIARRAAEYIEDNPKSSIIVYSDYAITVADEEARLTELPEPMDIRDLIEITTEAREKAARDPHGSHAGLTEAHGHADMAIAAYEMAVETGEDVMYAIRESDGNYAMLMRAKDRRTHRWTTARQFLGDDTPDRPDARTRARAAHIAAAAHQVATAMGSLAGQNSSVSSSLTFTDHSIRICLPLDQAVTTAHNGLSVEATVNGRYQTVLRYCPDTGDLLSFRPGVWTVYVQHLAQTARARMARATVPAPHTPGPEDFSPIDDVRAFGPVADRALNVASAAKKLVDSRCPRRPEDSAPQTYIDPKEAMLITVSKTSGTVEICPIAADGTTLDPVYAAYDGDYERPYIYTHGPWEVDLVAAVIEQGKGKSDDR